jgi:hypothetical protein
VAASEDERTTTLSADSWRRKRRCGQEGREESAI